MAGVLQETEPLCTLATQVSCMLTGPAGGTGVGSVTVGVTMLSVQPMTRSAPAMMENAERHGRRAATEDRVRSTR
jgi:hypothetical protein